MRRLSLGLGLPMAVLLLTSQAFAHHALGGKLPIDFTQGLLSGLAHPVIEIDHFAFVLAVGVLTALSQGGFLLPVWFVGGTMLGCVLSACGLQVPPNEWLVPASALVLGGYMAAGRGESGRWHGAIFLAAGLLHGLAYAQSIIGSHNNSLLGYLIGFAVVQTLVAWAAMVAAYGLWRGDRLYLNARVFGGVLAGVGLAALYQSGIARLFPLA